MKRSWLVPKLELFGRWLLFPWQLQFFKFEIMHVILNPEGFRLKAVVIDFRVVESVQRSRSVGLPQARLVAPSACPLHRRPRGRTDQDLTEGEHV